MKSKINYKSKKAIIITLILVALIAITTVAVVLFVKGNDNAEAIDGNTIENTNNISGNNSNKNDKEQIENNDKNETVLERRLDHGRHFGLGVSFEFAGADVFRLPQPDPYAVCSGRFYRVSENTGLFLGCPRITDRCTSGELRLYLSLLCH